MPPEVAAPEREALKIAVCLSGGGFRASTYGLGVLRYFAEAGLLQQVEVVCGVSGGSIAAAAVIAGYQRAVERNRALDGEAFEELICEPFVGALARRNIRNGALCRWLVRRPNPWGPDRGDVLGNLMRKRLFPELVRLSDLPDTPQLIITTTELAAGRAFRTSRDFMGGWDYGYIAPDGNASVGRAVAASAAVPVAFPPLRMKTVPGEFPKPTPRRLVLVDGGVYDNIGLEWLQGWDSAGRPPAAKPINFAIIVNASGPLRPVKHLWGALAWNRARNVQYAQTQATRVRWLMQDFISGSRTGLYLGITGDPRRFRNVDNSPVSPAFYEGALPSALVPALADLRTDLNKFHRSESRLLAYHGYWSAHARAKSILPNCAVPGTPAWTEYAGMTDGEAARWVDWLKRPRHRFGIGSKLR